MQIKFWIKIIPNTIFLKKLICLFHINIQHEILQPLCGLHSPSRDHDPLFRKAEGKRQIIETNLALGRARTC